MDFVYEIFNQLSMPQWLATLISLAYIYFAVKNKAVAFIFGVLASSFWCYESYFYLNLKFDALLQLFYVGMGLWGIYSWKYGSISKSELPIGRLELKQHALILVAGAVISIIMGMTGFYVKSSLPFLDAFTTGFSIIATFLLVRRYVENWIYWMVLNPLYMYIYWRSGAYLFIVIMAIYSIMAVIGYFNWKEILDNYGKNLSSK